MMVYHGGAAAVPNPDLSHSRKAVDFGAGFYVTPILDQAMRWGEKRKRRSGAATVSRYEYDEAGASSLKILRFEGYSEDWLDFIVRCRDLKDESDWDIVAGGVANDKVFDMLEAFFDGFATRAQTIDRLRMETPNLQMCFRAAAALQTLKFVGSEQI